jgi:hypothetical protein
MMRRESGMVLSPLAGRGGHPMTWVAIGYVAKRRAPRAGWVSPWPDHPHAGFPCDDPVEEICSVSSCIARPFAAPSMPENDNPLGLFSDPDSAWAAVPAAGRSTADLYAYRLWPVQFDEGREDAIELWWEPAVAPMPATFVRLGWDAVVGGNGHGFGCSPLSCNSGADIVECPQINRHCLVSDETSAIALARSFSVTQPEPGPYCVVEVWRHQPAGAEPAAATDSQSCVGFGASP